MQIALTGATGFVGRYIAQVLVDQGHSLVCWHRPTSDRSGFEKIASKVAWIPGQLCQEDACQKLVQGVDAVVHAAVEWEGPRNRNAGSHGAANVFMGRNLTGSLQLFQTAFEAKVPRFVFISTCAVHDVILSDRQLDEAHPLWPASFYGAHKAALEKFVHAFGLSQGWNICALRPTGVYGLGHPAATSRYYDLVGKVLRGESVSSAKGGKEVHALDVARAVDLLLNADPKATIGQAFNCYDRYVSEEEVARIAKEIAGGSGEISDLNRGPKNQIDNRKLRALGMTFGGDALLRQTVKELVKAHKA